MKKIIFLTVLLSVFVPLLAQGQALVPCGGPDCPCTLCHFFLMLQRIVNYLLFSIAPILAVLMIVIGGAMMMSAYASQSGAEKINQSRKLFGAIVVGLIIIYGAWILINMFLATIGVAEWTGLRNWWEIECEYSCDPWSEDPGGGGVIPDAPFPGCTDPAAINHNPKANVDDGSCRYEEWEGVCGDGIIQSPNANNVNEVCDSDNLAGRTCMFYGYGPDAVGLVCQNDCLGFDSSGCSEPPPPPDLCGNGIIDLEIGEECDCGQDEICSLGELANTTCQDYNYPAGELKCFDCKFDVSGCSNEYCGDGIIQSPNGAGTMEVCDSTELLGNTCQDYGYKRGELKCLDSCTNFDVAGCYDDYCGDGIIQRPNGEGVMEACDGLNVSGLNCQSQGYDGGLLRCNLGCTGLDTSQCTYEDPIGCTSCPGNELGVCNISDCPVTHGCNYAQVDLMGGLKGGICVNPDDCHLCGTVPGDTCTSVECNSIGAPCKFMQDVGNAGICYLDGQCNLCASLISGCTPVRCARLGSSCQYVEGSPPLIDPYCISR